MTYTEVLNTNYNFPNINIFNVVDENGNLSSYKVRPYEGYVMYDTRREDTEPQYNEETGETEEVPVTYYYTVAGYPKTSTFANFPWVAVLRSSVDENYIFGTGNNTEVM